MRKPFLKNFIFAMRHETSAGNCIEISDVQIKYGALRNENARRVDPAGHVFSSEIVVFGSSFGA